MLYLVPSPLSQKTPKQPVLEADLPLLARDADFNAIAAIEPQLKLLS